MTNPINVFTHTDTNAKTYKTTNPQDSIPSGKVEVPNIPNGTYFFKVMPGMNSKPTLSPAPSPTSNNRDNKSGDWLKFSVKNGAIDKAEHFQTTSKGEIIGKNQLIGAKDDIHGESKVYVSQTQDRTTISFTGSRSLDNNKQPERIPGDNNPAVRFNIHHMAGKAGFTDSSGSFILLDNQRRNADGNPDTKAEGQLKYAGELNDFKSKAEPVANQGNFT